MKCATLSIHSCNFFWCEYRMVTILSGFRRTVGQNTMNKHMFLFLKKFTVTGGFIHVVIEKENDGSFLVTMLLHRTNPICVFCPELFDLSSRLSTLAHTVETTGYIQAERIRLNNK